MKNYDVTIASSVLEGRVGFRQTVAKKEYLPLAADIVADPAKGQLFVNSVSEYWLRVEAMSNALEFAEGYDIDTYDSGGTFVAGDKVKKIVNDREYVWVALQSSGPADPKDPQTSPQFWESYLSNRLRQYRESVSRELIASAISSFTNSMFTREAKKSTTFFTERTTPQTTQLKDRFVGVEIAVREQDKLTKILVSGKIGLYITGAQADVNIYFYNSSKNQPIQVYTIPAADIVNDRFKWYDLKAAEQELVIDLYDEDYNQGGRFYLGFYESELAAAGQGYKHYESIVGEYASAPGFSMIGVEILSTHLNGTNLPNLGEYYDSVSYNDETPLNLRYEVSESYYPMIKENIHLFDNIYRYKLAKNILFDMMHSNRINRIEDNAQAKLDEILFGIADNPSNNGISKVIEQHWEKLMSDMKSLFTEETGPIQGPI